MIGPKTVLQHVIDSCKESASYINHNSHHTNIMAKVALLIPFNDEIKDHYKNRMPVIEGPQDDVLARYVTCLERFKADYIVRITADCPLIPRYLISKFINVSTKNKYDYFSNVDERFRTHADGLDCEVISAKAMRWLDKNAIVPSDREHVTPLIRRFAYKEMRIGHAVSYVDQTSEKLSVDTPEDLERVRKNYERISSAMDKCEELYGKGSTHRF